MHKIILTCLAGMWSFLALGQEALTLETAIEEALAHNYGIQVAQYNIESARNNAYAGAAGLLPSVSLNGTASYNNSNATAEIINQDPSPDAPPYIDATLNGLQTSSAGASVGVNYTVFDGLGNVNNFRILKQNISVAEEQVRGIVETQISQVVNAYYQVARLTNSLRIQHQTLDRSRQRLTFIENQAEFGIANKLALLNAQVDLNTDSVSLASAELDLANAVRDLNLLMGRTSGGEYAVEETVTPLPPLSLEELLRQTRERNADLTLATENQQVAELNLRVAQAARYPTLSVNASYGYNYSNNGPISVARTVQSLGLSAGATLSFNIWNGNRVSRNIQGAQINLASSRTQMQQAEQQVLTNLTKSYATYQNSRKVLALNQKSLEAAELNFARTQDAFELGQATGVQLREAQLNLLRVQNQINDLAFIVKSSETDLLRLSGQLVQTGTDD